MIRRILLLPALLAVMAAPSSAADRRRDAEQLVDRLSRGEFAAICAGFDATMTAALPEAKLRAAWGSVTQQAGPFQARLSTRTESVPPYDVIFVTTQFKLAPLDIKVVYDPAGKVAGLFFTPAAAAPALADSTPPAYVKPGAFREVEVTLGSEPWKLPGTLALPAGTGPFPALLLVQGSGPNDRDESIGPNKPFRDLAQGLASRGIAVLRYEKRTRAYAQKLAGSHSVTLAEEVVDDAVAAIRLLSSRPEIDRSRIFVLGHSLGGMLLPRIARGAGSVAGLIAMAAPTRSIDVVMLEQLAWIGSLPGTSDAERKSIASSEAKIKSVATLDPAHVDTSTAILGAPAAYWLELRALKPAEEAKNAKVPMLILQGERDYQSTMVDFAGWKSALAGRSDVTLKSYPDLNHLFMVGKGKSTPKDYATAGHVAPVVIDDLAAWIRR